MNLTADLVARAVVAAAVHYGDDPERAVTVPRGILKRCLKPAALGLHAALGGDAKRYARVLGLDPKNVYKDRTPTVMRAAEAVAEAVACSMGPGWKRPVVEPMGETSRGDLYADAIAAVLPQLLAAHPEGANTAQIAQASGLNRSQACSGARVLHTRKAARWTRLPNRNAKILKPWTAAPTDDRPEPLPFKATGEHRPKTPLQPVIAAPVVPPRPAPPRPRADLTPAATLGGRICRMLRGTDANTQGLATLLDAKELTVSQCLAAMEVEGLVVAGPIPAEGIRFRRWRLREDIAA